MENRQRVARPYRASTRLCAHALNPTMHRASAAKTATFNSASIIFPSIESRLPFEGLIRHAWEIFPFTGSASDDHHSLALLISGLQGGREGRTSGPLVAPATGAYSCILQHA